MDPPPLQQQYKRAYHAVKCLQIVLLLISLSFSIYATTRNSMFVILPIISFSFLIVHVVLFSLNTRGNVVKKEKIILALFAICYAYIIVIVPEFESDKKGNTTELQSHGGSDNVQNTTEKYEETFSFPIINKTNETGRLWEAMKTLSHNVSKRDADSPDKIKRHHPEFKYIYFYNLVLICLILIFQGVLLYLAVKINEQMQLLNADAGFQNEDDIPLQPLAPAIENLELVEDSGEGPSAEQPQPSQNVVTHRTSRASEDIDMQLREDLDGVDFDSLAEAGPSMTAEEPLTASLEMRESSINLCRAASSSHEGEPLLTRSGIGTHPKEVKEASSQEELAESSL